MVFTSYWWGKAHLTASFMILLVHTQLLNILIQRLGLCLSDLYCDVDLGSELWPQKKEKIKKCCCNGKCCLNKGNLRAALLYSCPMPSTYCSTQPCAERDRPTAIGAWEISAWCCGPFIYEQFAAFSASQMTQRTLSGNMSSEQNTVLNEAWFQP